MVPISCSRLRNFPRSVARSLLSSSAIFHQALHAWFLYHAQDYGTFQEVLHGPCFHHQPFSIKLCTHGSYIMLKITELSKKCCTVPAFIISHFPCIFILVCERQFKFGKSSIL